MQSSPIIIATRRVSKWHILMYYIAGNAGHHCSGVKLGKSSFWARDLARGRETGAHSNIELENSTISTEKLCRHKEKGFGISDRRLCVSQGLTYERSQ